MRSIQINSPFKVSKEMLFILTSFLVFTCLAFFYGIKNNIYYSLNGVPTYWFHLSFHYLASGWTWVLMLPLFLFLSKKSNSLKQFLGIVLISSVPIAIIHRFLAIFFDTTFRWLMGYTQYNLIFTWEKVDQLFYSGIFDSLLTFTLLSFSILLFYKRHLIGDKKIVKETENEDDHTLQRIVASKNGKLILLNVERVTSLNSEGNYLKVFYDGNWFLIRETAKKMEQNLDKDIFFRINRSTIVNVNFIQDLEHYSSGGFLVTMKNGHVYKSSKTYKSNVDRLISN